jgi:hypothetical protein
MEMIRRALSGSLLVVSSLFAMAQQYPSSDGLATLYKAILSREAHGNVPRMEEIAGHFDNMRGMDVAEIKSALPWMQRALESPNPSVRVYGILGLYAIDERPDSASLIGHLVPVIAKQFDDPYLCELSIETLSYMKPKPPEDAISYLLEALRSGRQLHFDPKTQIGQSPRPDEDLGPGVVFALVQVDPNRNDIARAIDAYMVSRMKTADQKVATLNALATRPVMDARLIADISANLTDQTEDVRISAIRALERSGPTGVETARQQLERMAGAGEASNRVREAARQAIESASEMKNK